MALILDYQDNKVPSLGKKNAGTWEITTRLALKSETDADVSSIVANNHLILCTILNRGYYTRGHFI